MEQAAVRRIEWQQVVLFGSRSRRVRQDLQLLAIGPAFVASGEPNGAAGACSEGVMPPRSDFELIVQLEADTALLVAELRSAADRLEYGLNALRLGIFPLAQELL